MAIPGDAFQICILKILIRLFGSIKTTSTVISDTKYRLSSHGVLLLFFRILGAWDGLRYFIVALPEPSI